MIPLNLLALGAALTAIAHAQGTSTSATPSSSSSPTTTSSSAITTHSVSVGAEGFKFSPPEVTNATVGDVIEFRFYPGGHTVVQAGFGFPCIPYDMSGPNRHPAFFSGQLSPQISSANPPTFHVTVNDTDPIFFYCSAPDSCVKHHMIGVINPSGNQTLAAQLAAANNVTFQLAPGEPFPSETGSPSSTASATSTPTGAGSTGGGDGGGGNGGLSSGAIAGIAIGAAAVLVLAGALVYLCGRRGGLDKAYRRSTQTFPPPMVDGKFTPKSPGQATFSTQHYSTQGPPQNFVQSPGMLSPNQGTFYPSPDPNLHSPPIGAMGQQGHFPNQATTPPLEQHRQASPAVELPASQNPGNSPLPNYQPNRQFSWAQGGETHYRPGDKV